MSSSASSSMLPLCGPWPPLLAFGALSAGECLLLLFLFGMHCITTGVLLYAAIDAWRWKKAVAGLCLAVAALFVMVGLSSSVLAFVLGPEVGVGLLVGLPVLGALGIWARRKATAVALLALAGLYLLVLIPVLWTEGSHLREDRARWAAEIAQDPVSLKGVIDYHNNRGGLCDRDLELLRTTTRLQHLDLHQSLSQGEQLRYLTGLSQLQSLSLKQNPCLGDASLRHLAGLTTLEELDLSSCWTNITDNGLRHLAPLTQLRKLTLSSCWQLTDAGLAHLTALTELRQLNIGSTNVGDDGLRSLARLPKLEELNLQNDRRITSAGLQCLRALPTLRVVNLWGTQVTAEEVRKLQLALPNCKIDRDHSTARP